MCNENFLVFFPKKFKDKKRKKEKMPPKSTEKKSFVKKTPRIIKSDAYAKVYRKTKRKIGSSRAFLEIDEKEKKIRRDIKKWNSNNRIKKLVKVSKETKRNQKILNELKSSVDKLKKSEVKEVSLLVNFVDTCFQNIIQCAEESTFVLSLCENTHKNLMEQYNYIKNLNIRNREMWISVFSELNNELKEINTIVPMGTSSAEEIKKSYERLGKPVKLIEGTKYNKNNFTSLYIPSNEN